MDIYPMTDSQFKAGSWPLYDELKKQHEGCGALEPKELQAMPLLLRCLDAEGLQIVGLLIRAYGEDKLANELPFDGAQDMERSTAQFDIRKFDPCLQRMLISFTMIHADKK